MSNFNIFDDPIAPDGESVSNPLFNSPQTLNQSHTTHYCIRCLHEKSRTEFSSDELLLTAPIPLEDITNDQNIVQRNKRRKNNGPTCNICREKVKRHGQVRRAKADETIRLETVPWKEVVRMIEEGFDSQSISTDNSSLPSERLLISNLFKELPPEVAESNHSPATAKDRKEIAQYVADQYAEAEGFRFQFHKEYQLSSQARGYPVQFAKARCLIFQCSQQRRAYKFSSLPYGRTRNRRGKKRFDCKGEVKVFLFRRLNLRQVYFLQDAHHVDYGDIAIDLRHTVHPGRGQFGVPLKVREWIRDNPRSTPLAQREELLLAIKRGEIPGIQLNSRFLSPTLIHFWWRKAYGTTAYISEDPWENAAHLLREHPLVSAVFYSELIVDKQSCSFS